MANFYTDNSDLKHHLTHPLMQRIVALKEREYADARKYDRKPPALYIHLSFSPFRSACPSGQSSPSAASAKGQASSPLKKTGQPSGV